MRWLASFRFFMAALSAQENVSTFSIVGYDPVTQEWGITVASRYFSVGSVVPWAEAGVGAVATQANVNVGYGPRGLELLRQGLSAKEVLKRLQDEDTFDGKDGRQIAIIDRNGNIAAFTGPKAPNWAGDRQGKTWSAQGNILLGPQVVEAMGKAFESTQGELAEKLYAALKAGDDAGGDSRGKQSASMLIVRKGGGRNTNNDRPVYINVDDSPAPIPELRRLLNMNLALLYQEKRGRLLRAGQRKEAREAAAAVLRYAPTQVDSYISIAMLDYVLGDKTSALTELRTARTMEPKLLQRMESLAKVRAEYTPLIEDAEFMKQVFGEGK